MERDSGTLYVVGTPLGNMEDVSARAVRILQEVDLVAAEDTRRTGRFLAMLDIKKPLISYYQHNERARCAQLVERMRSGEKVALVSDAGMPGISDPGCLLIQAAIEAEIPIVPIPSATAAVVALVISGLDTERYVFEGFLPRAGKKRESRLRELAEERRTMVIYEAPHRLLQTLTDLCTVLGNRPAVVARELTKIYEECIRGNLCSLMDHFQATPPRGECVIVVAGKEAIASDHTAADNISREDLATLLRARLQDGLSRRDAVRSVVTETGLPRRLVYQASLALGNDNETS